MAEITKEPAGDVPTDTSSQNDPTTGFRFAPKVSAEQGQLFTVTTSNPPVGSVHLDIAPTALDAVIDLQQQATTHVYQTLVGIHADLQDFFPKISEPFPAVVDGVILNPDGSPAADVSVEALEPVYSSQNVLASAGWPSPHAVTDLRGAFRLNMPSVPIPDEGLQLKVQGGNASLNTTIRRVLLVEGHLGQIVLQQVLVPLNNASIVAGVKDIQADIMATTQADVLDNPKQFATPSQQLTIGEGDCARLFRSNSGVIESFRYCTLIRLVEPHLNGWRPVIHATAPPPPAGTQVERTGDYIIPFPVPDAQSQIWGLVDPQTAVAKLQSLGQVSLANRTPISQPIDISAFHNQLETAPASVPKAATLGLGYIVDMEQTWIPAGMSLGDLIYSLPLAPGEQQRIAIEESAKSYTDFTRDSFSADEFQTFRESQDSSAQAAFQSAFHEAATGGSHIDSGGRTTSAASQKSGGILGSLFGSAGASAGYGNSSSSGNTNSWQNTSRDFTSSAAEQMHSALGRVAAASRSGSQTSIRMASETERTQVTTRVVTNHNKGFALTMIYFQVLRHFSVTTEVDDVQLVCFVPMELIQFLPTGQPFSLPGMPGAGVNIGPGTPRQQLLDRYAMILRYWDVINPFFQRVPDYAYGMRALRDFASNPEAVPQSSTLQQDILKVVLSGTFLPCEDVFVTVVTKSGGALAPVKLTLTTLPNPVIDLTPEQFTSRDELLGALKKARLTTSVNASLEASIPLPNWVARTDIARFDISRRYSSLTYRLKPPGIATPDWVSFFNFIPQLTVSFSPAELEQQLGGPIVSSGTAKVDATDFLPPGIFSAGDQMASTLPIPALRVAQILSFADLLRIETVFHHVVRNIVFYSKAVWAALSAEERAILLERFTIGVPAGGIPTSDQGIPLLNCVANRVLGFFGNSIVMPFSIPPDLATSMQVTSRDIQDALLRFHRQAFQPPRSSITLPAQGTLGEAVLGCCNSAEKIDLTRFWNWQDSPSDQADAIPTSVFQPPQTIPSPAAGTGTSGGATNTGPSGSIISISSPPTSSSDALLQSLVSGAPNLTSQLNLSGLDTLQKQVSADTSSASAGRDKAIDANTAIQTQAMKSAEGMVKSISDAIAAANGGGKPAAK